MSKLFHKVYIKYQNKFLKMLFNLASLVSLLSSSNSVTSKYKIKIKQGIKKKRKLEKYPNKIVTIILYPKK